MMNKATRKGHNCKRWEGYKQGTLRGMKRFVEDAVGEAEIVVEMEWE